VAVNAAACWAKVAWQCQGAQTLSSAVAAARQTLAFMLPGIEGGQLSYACAGTLKSTWSDTATVRVVTSDDPNDKEGLRGVGAGRVVAGSEPLTYVVRFENAPTAPVAAQRVVVSDALDTLRVAPASVSLGRITWGDVQLTPPAGLTQYATRVDLRPGRDLIVDVRAALDSTGSLTWRFESLDPLTGQPTKNDTLGFLPPNMRPPEGDGSVAFSVSPRPGLATGAVIANQASVTFDANAAVLTPVWTNTLDTGLPASHVMPLAAVQDSGRFTVRWTPESADVWDYTVLVSENGGAYRVWRQNTKATADTFTARAGSGYGFYCVARDSTGNVETDAGSADATTQVAAQALAADPAKGSELALAGALSNPATQGLRIEFTLPSRAPATLELIDAAGRRVWRREVGSMGPGKHVMDLGRPLRVRPGLYFIRLAQGGTARVARAVVMQ
jgi:hypothetical protein